MFRHVIAGAALAGSLSLSGLAARAQASEAPAPQLKAIRVVLTPVPDRPIAMHPNDLVINQDALVGGARA
jgi:hypothetical protein